MSPRDPDAELPMMVLDGAALAGNLATMAELCRRAGVLHAPHGKTTMSPELIHRQLAAGAWAVTVATGGQLRRMREWGVPRVLVANVLVERGPVRRLAAGLAADPDFEAYCYVDSVAGVDLMSEHLAGLDVPRPIPVLLEVGYRGGRTGTRSGEEARAVAARVHAEPGLTLAGVAGFEGMIEGDPAPFLTGLRDIAASLAFEVAEPIVTAGGSAAFDSVLAVLGPAVLPFPARLVLRSGCYLTHDDGMYARSSPLSGARTPVAGSGLAGVSELTPALRLWAGVWSRPEPDLAIVGFGKRDAPYDAGFPVALRVWDTRAGAWRAPGPMPVVTRLDDQHAYLRLPSGAELHVGDRVVFGVSHPCGAFDRWRFLPVVDHDDQVIDGVRTYF